MPGNNAGAKACGACVGFTGVLLIVILVPLSFSYIDYYEYGLVQRKTTGRVDTSRVYDHGRYLIGPDFTFLKYQADAHAESFRDLSVFSDREGGGDGGGGGGNTVGVTFSIDVDFTYLLLEDEIGLLHEDLARTYRAVISSRAKEAIRNAASSVSFSRYFEDRESVERHFRTAIQRRWEAAPSLHCEMDQFHLAGVLVTESVANKQLESRLQDERNDREEFLQKAQVERERTAVAVNEIALQKEKELRTARAEANLALAKARSTASRILAEAQSNGTQMLFLAAGIETVEQKTAFTYIRTLQNRDEVDLQISYLPGGSITPVLDV